jgi:hypothetical protein
LTNPFDKEVKLKVPRFHEYINWVDFDVNGYENNKSMKDNYTAYVGIFQ